MVERKKNIRKDIAARKSKYSKEQLEEMSYSIIKNLMELDVYKKANVVLLYYSMPDEVNTKGLISNAHVSKKIILPVVTKAGLLLKEYISEESLGVSKYGIKEPVGNIYLGNDDIDLVVVPGIAFDRSLNRMGRGMGYYDGLLPKINAPKVAICFDFQLIDEVPTDERDIKMDMVVSESGIIEKESPF